VDLTRCTGCGDCADACPVVLPGEYDMGLSDRKAAYRKYAQAIPGAYAIEKAGKAPCRLACPAGLNVQGYVQMVGEGKYDAALKIIMEDLPLPGVLGRVCPHPCEEACRRLEVDSAVAIRDLKRLAADMGDVGKVDIHCLSRRSERVAIVGSGPAGLSAAYHLAKAGIRSTIFEALPAAGGMLRVGIPDHRLPPEVLEREIDVILGLGVELKLGEALDRDFTVESLLTDGFGAVYLAIGAHQGMKLSIPGEDAEGVRQGVDFLRELNLIGTVSTGCRIAVIGGGNVAVDVARSAVRLGAGEVTIVYRRTRAQMPAWEEEVCAAEEEGVKLIYLAAPVEVLTDGGKVSGIKCIRMELGEPDASGRRRPVPMEGDIFEMEIEQLIPAIGQRPDLGGLKEVEGLSFTRWGTIEADDISYQTNRKEVFVGGDAFSGPSLAIRAVAAGKEAAESIRRYLDGEDLRAGRQKPLPDSRSYRPIPTTLERRDRARVRKIPVSDRSGNFREVELGLDMEDGRAEAERCLNCGSCCECYQCVEACGAEAVTLETHGQKPESVSIEVGSVILASGVKPFDPSGMTVYSRHKSPNVLTALEFERILSASGPTAGRMVRPSDGTEPKSIAWLQCVGSRDVHHCGHEYCSSVCCMYAVKQAVIAKEHAGRDLDCTIFYIDMRTHGKDFDRYREAAENVHGVKFVKTRVPSVETVEGRSSLIVDYVDDAGRPARAAFDLVVLSTGLETDGDFNRLSAEFGFDLTEGGFCSTDSFLPVHSPRRGLFACGTSLGPRDIPQSVIDAGAAAAAAGSLLAEARNTLTHKKEIPPQHDVAGERPRIGVFVCRCGINIAGIVDVASVRDYAASLPYVEYVTDNLYTCSQDTQEIMTDVIKERNLNRVVVAACTPKTHEPLFQDTLVNAGLNKYLFEMTNIRNQDSWVHKDLPQAATEKAMDLVRMAVAKVALVEPVEDTELDLNRRVLVIGAGVSGISAALALASQGYPVTIVERSPAPGGHAAKLHTTWKGENIKNRLEGIIEAAHANPMIELECNTKITSVDGFVGNFTTVIDTPGGSRTIEHGAAIISTGAKELTPREYLYGQHEAVMTHLELDEVFLENPERLDGIETAVFIQCVGSRDAERPYCSRVCCTHTMESALKLKKRNPDCRIFVLYRDIRTYGEREALYREARLSGVMFLRYDLTAKPQVSGDGGRIRIDANDPVIGRVVSIPADLLVLAAAVIPHRNERLAGLFKVALNEDGFFTEKHAKLGPNEFASDGVYLCGMAHYPKSLDESVAQAMAAASRACTLLASDKVRVSGAVAGVDMTACSGCGVCVEICPYSAPSLRYDGRFTGMAEINPALCKGCGLCTASCRSGAITLKGFSPEQIMAMIEAI
jgi:heterodisulfide reductase subunit A-like polyferredoxin